MASARRIIPTTRSVSGPRARTATSWCRSAKAYFGFTDEELKKIDRFVRNNTTERFGPVREIAHEAEKVLVFEVAFEACNARPGTSPASPCASPRQPAALGQATARGRPVETLEKILARIRERPRRNGRRRPLQGAARGDEGRDRARLGRFGRFDMADNINRFLGGPPLAVLGKLVLLSV
jgi:hypothetical protein